jgi:hypothetical protein
MNKRIISVTLLYLFQFFAVSCIDCEPIKTFERRYKGFELKAWNTSGFQNNEVSSSVSKNSFGLSVFFEFGLSQIVHKSKLNFNSFGFGSAYAWSCPNDEYINIDPISSILITVKNTENQLITDVTDNFTIYAFNGKQLLLNDFFEYNKRWHQELEIDLTESDNIPNFSVVEQTQEVIFE